MALLLIVTGSDPSALNASATIAPAGTRILMPFKSAGATIGRLTVVIWRIPLSNAPTGNP